ncbi:MAG: M1 family metallopeptidase [Thermomicrobiales bacterium]
MPRPLLTARATLGLILLATLLFPTLTVAQGLPATPATGLVDTDPTLYAPVLPDVRDEYIAETAGRLSRYRVDAELTAAAGDQPAVIAGSLDLHYLNDTGDEQATLYLRLYPNGEEYAEGALTIDAVTIDGTTMTPELAVDDTLATLTLPAPIPPDTTVELALTFRTTLPTDPVASYGMFSYDLSADTYAFAHWLPLLAGYDPISGWRLGPLSRNGDPVFSNTALFDVTVTAPGDLILVTTGSEVESSTENGLTRRRFVSGPSRDFVMAADSNYLSSSQTVGGTVVTSWYNPDSEAGGLAVLDQAAVSLEIYSRLFGPYPFAEMDLAQVDLGNGAGGVEFPQIMFIGGDYYRESAITRAIPDFLEFIVVHEVAHQWWYAQVGNNQYVDAFIDEGLTNAVTAYYFLERYGEESYQEQVDINLKLTYFTMLFGQGDQVVDQPTDAFPNVNAYATTVYGKAALGFDELRKTIGDDAFFAALLAYHEEHRFTVATPDDLKAAFERASGQDLTEFWRHWFEAAEGRHDYTRRDYADLLVDLGR